jgi:hypothetical protein
MLRKQDYIKIPSQALKRFCSNDIRFGIQNDDETLLGSKNLQLHGNILA